MMNRDSSFDCHQCHRESHHHSFSKMVKIFKNRNQAGQELSQKVLKSHPKPPSPVIVLGLPRGGIPVAFQLAHSLKCPLDSVIVRKLGCPYNPEVAMGAIADISGSETSDENVCVVWNDRIAGLFPESQRRLVFMKEREEMDRRKKLYTCPNTNALPLNAYKTVFVVDDGIATGATMKVAVQAVRKGAPDAKVIVAIPVAARDSYNELLKLADDVVQVWVPHDFYGVGQWYQDFNQTDDSEVVELLRQSVDWQKN